MKGYRDTGKNKNIEKTKIAIIGIGKGAGTTMVSTLLAFCLSKYGVRTAYCELINFSGQGGSVYYSLAVDRECEENNFIDFYRQIRLKKPIKTLSNMRNNINWALVTPSNREGKLVLTLEEQQRLVNNISGQVTICDISIGNFAQEEGKINELLADMDYIIGVVDPLPVKLMTNMDIFRLLKREQVRNGNVYWLVNKMNPGVHKRDMIKGLRLEEYGFIPMIKAETIYDNQYRWRMEFSKAKELAEIESTIGEILKIMGIITEKTHHIK